MTRNPAARCSKFYKQAPARNKEIQPLNPQEVGLFLRTVWNLEASRKYYPLLLIAIHTGLRSSEINGLRWADIDWNGKFLMVRRAIVMGRVQSTKTDKVRRVDLSDALLEALRDHRQAMRVKWLKKGSSEIPEWIFASKEGTPASIQSIKDRHFYPNLARAGLRRVRFHDLRHTFASLLISNGESFAYVKEQLGHSSIKMTIDTYTHLEPGSNRQAVNKLPTIKDAPAEALEKAGGA